MLTVDTHFPEGFLSNTCKSKGALEIKGIVRCTAQQIGNFLKFIEDQGLLPNTVVMIVGDHLTMPTDLSHVLERQGQRSLFNLILSPENLVPNRKTINHLSTFPTLMYAMGFRFEDNRLALGASGFGRLSGTYILDDMAVGELNKKLESKSELYPKFWFKSVD